MIMKFFRRIYLAKKLSIYLKKLIIALILNCLYFNLVNASESRNLTIYAEKDFSYVLSKIARIFSAENNVVVSLNFNLTNMIADVKDGEPADLFISKKQNLIEELRTEGLIDVYNYGYIAKDRIVLLTSNKNNLPFMSKFVENINFYDSLKIINDKFGSVMYDTNSENALNFINHLQNNSKGFKNLKIIQIDNVFDELFEDKNSFIITSLSNSVKYKNYIRYLSYLDDNQFFYQALVIAGDNMEIGREFLRFMQSERAVKILHNSGFTVR